MADPTNAKCQEACRQVGQCCSTEYCQIAAEAMTEAGHSFPKMPFGKTFVVDGKCIVPRSRCHRIEHSRRDDVLEYVKKMVRWPRGEAVLCKSIYTGSSPVRASIL